VVGENITTLGDSAKNFVQDRWLKNNHHLLASFVNVVLVTIVVLQHLKENIRELSTWV
jgi:regulator of sigma D